MIEIPSLYPHQTEHKDRVRTSLAVHKRVILQASPGQGKTRMAKWVLGTAANRQPNANQSGFTLFTVHRRGLVDNACYSFDEQPKLPHGVIMSGRPGKLYVPTQVASIDTLLSWWVEDVTWTGPVTFDLIVFDESHSHLQKLRKLLTAHDRMRAHLKLHPAYVLGLTATPECVGQKDVFGEIVSGPSTQWLIDNTFLSPFRYFQATEGKLGGLVRRGGEFTKESVSVAMEGLSGDLVRDWLTLAKGLPTIGFFPRLKHAREAETVLRAHGIKAEYLDGDTPDDRRAMVLAALSSRQVQYVCNVGVVERGTDVPCVECVQLCTAIGTKSRYLQMIGRGSRVHPGKQHCLVLDHGGNVQRHGFFEDPHVWVLDQSAVDFQAPVARPPVVCPKCKAMYRGGKCSACGYEPERKVSQADKLSFDGSPLVEVTPHNHKTKPFDINKAMIAALYRAAYRNLNWRQAVLIAQRDARKRGESFRVPHKIQIGASEWKCITPESPDAARKVIDLFPFLRKRTEQRR